MKDIKKKLAKRSGYPVKHVRLFDDDDVELEDVAVPRRGRTFHMDPPEIDVDLPGGNRTKLGLLPEMTIDDVKAILEDKTGEYTGRNLILASDDLKLDITFKEDEQKLTFSKHLYAETSPEYIDLVKKTASAFDQELSAGKHQEHFGRVISLVRKLRGIN